MDGGVGGTIVLVVLMLLVIFAAYFTTRFLSSKARNITKCKYIEVKDRMFLGRDKHILLIEVGAKAYLVGITNQNINVIGALSKDEIIPLTEEQNASVVSGLKGFMGKFAGFMKNAAAAQEDLKKARAQYRRGSKPQAPEEKPEEPDDIEKMMEALKKRRSRYSEGRREGDEE